MWLPAKLHIRPVNERSLLIPEQLSLLLLLLGGYITGFEDSVHGGSIGDKTRYGLWTMFIFLYPLVSFCLFTKILLDATKVDLPQTLVLPHWRVESISTTGQVWKGRGVVCEIKRKPLSDALL